MYTLYTLSPSLPLSPSPSLARWQVLRHHYARKLKMLPNGRVVDMGLRYPQLSRNPRVRHRHAVDLATTPTPQVPFFKFCLFYLYTRSLLGLF
jgi:hypothetical protein